MRLAMNAALILVDVQFGHEDGTRGERNNPAAEANIARLLAEWRSSKRAVFHVQHDSLKEGGSFFPGTPGHDFKPEGQPLAGEEIHHKTVNSGFIGTGLEKGLRDRGITTVVIAGFQTNHCVSVTARTAGDLGFQTFVITDASAAFSRLMIDGRLRSAQDVHDSAISDLHGELVIATTTEEVLAALH